MISINNFGKKGVATQSFNIITAVVIMGVILLFGGTSVYKLISNAEDVEKANFRNDFNAEIDAISSKYGSVKILELEGLRAYNVFCIFKYKADVSDGDFADSEYISPFPLIKGDLVDGTANIFLLTDSIDERFVNEKISVADEKGFICEEISDNGVAKLKLEGMGRTVRVSFVS